MDKLRVGFIGGGRITDLHAMGYRDNPRARIYAVCDIRPEVAQARAREWGADRWYTDYRQLLQDPQVDAVEVITPHYLHAPMTVEALKAGKHVSVQKPMCLNVTEANAMVNAAKSSGKLFRVFENFLFYPPYNRAKELLESGAIGEPRTMRMKIICGRANGGWPIPQSALEWRNQPALSGGGPLVFDYGHHMFALALYLLGHAEKVYSWIEQRETRPGWHRDSPAMIMWKVKDRPVYGTFEAVDAEEMYLRARYYASDEWVEVTGSHGVLWINGCTSSFLGLPPVVLYRDGKLTHYTDLETDWAVSFIRSVHDFADAILEGRPSTLTGEEGREVLRFSLAAMASAREGREVRLEEVVR